MNDDNRRVLTPFLLTAVFLVVIISISIITIRHFDLQFGFSDLAARLRQGDVYEVTQAAPDLPASALAPETINYRQMARLREMLKSGGFDALNEILNGYQKAFEADPANEYKLSDAYAALAVPDSDNETYFKQWIHDSPDAYQPYLAFARYNYERGLKSRGAAWARDTSDAQFEEMRHCFSEALRNIDQALALHPDLLIAYPVLIGIYNCDGEDVLEDRTIKHGMELFPSSSLVLFSALWSKQPRWGGSYSQMEALVKKAEAHIDVNPSLGALYGLIYLDQARVYRRRKKYQEAIDLLNKALSFGDLCIIYSDLARIYYYNIKDYDLALEYVNRSIELRPTKADGYRIRSVVYLAREQYDESKADLERAMLINPVDPDIIGWKEKASNIIMHEGHKQFKADHQGAIEKYNLSLAFDEENVDAYFWRGRAHYDVKAFDAALTDFQSAIAIDPRHFESYRMIDYILVRDRQWETIIAYWNDYISLVPDHADAYYERSGTHYHNKDMEHALEDLKQACDLGHEEACKRYEGWTRKQ